MLGLKEEKDVIRLLLTHCKFARDPSGARVEDVVAVRSQAVRSAKWKWKFKDLCRHILQRDRRLATPKRATRFLKGDAAALNRFLKTSRFKELRPEIMVVQPGLSRTGHTTDQVAVLASAHSYLKQTVGVDLKIACGA